MFVYLTNRVQLLSDAWCDLKKNALFSLCCLLFAMILTNVVKSYERTYVFVEYSCRDADDCRALNAISTLLGVSVSCSFPGADAVMQENDSFFLLFFLLIIQTIVDVWILNVNADSLALGQCVPCFCLYKTLVDGNSYESKRRIPT